APRPGPGRAARGERRRRQGGARCGAPCPARAARRAGAEKRGRSGAADRRHCSPRGRGGCSPRAPQAALPAPPGCAAPGCGATAAAMNLFRLFARAAPQLAPAGPRDAPGLAKLHAASFAPGWSENEFERLLIDCNVLAHRLASGRAGRNLGFILSRLAADEAEILSVAVTASQRGRGLAGRLLDHHLRALAGRGARAVFLEVDED